MTSVCRELMRPLKQESRPGISHLFLKTPASIYTGYRLFPFSEMHLLKVGRPLNEKKTCRKPVRLCDPRRPLLTLATLPSKSRVLERTVSPALPTQMHDLETETAYQSLPPAQGEGRDMGVPKCNPEELAKHTEKQVPVSTGTS